MRSSQTYDNIEGVILAGGKNSRYRGEMKSGILVRGRSILSTQIEVLESVFTKVTISTNTPDVLTEASHLKMVSDKKTDLGPLGGVHAVMAKSEAEAIFIIAGDMPFPSGKLIRMMIEHFQTFESEALIPRINNMIEPMHAIYSLSLMERLDLFLAESNKYSIREFLKVADVDYIEIEELGFDSSVFTNINTPDDFKRINSDIG